jgi:hypothetical protein
MVEDVQPDEAGEQGAERIVGHASEVRRMDARRLRKGFRRNSQILAAAHGRVTGCDEPDTAPW